LHNLANEEGLANGGLSPHKNVIGSVYNKLISASLTYAKYQRMYLKIGLESLPLLLVK
jgi:hypothetical protein